MSYLYVGHLRRGGDLRHLKLMTRDTHAGRQRKKKCDEQTPVCGGCRFTDRSCQWPASTDLRDRRFTDHERSRHRRPHSGVSLHLDVRNDLSDPPLDSRPPWWTSNLLARDMEVVISQHFIDQSYGLIMLPNSHIGFYHGWLAEIQELIPSCEAMYYSMLACAASHLHLKDSCATMQQLALMYYSKALEKLSRLLAINSNLENHNGLLSSVILLNIHGVSASAVCVYCLHPCISLNLRSLC